MVKQITRRASLGRMARLLPLACGAFPRNQSLARADESSSAGWVVSVSEAASRVGATILKRGGNAIDAAIATGFALAATYPAAGNIGGGGFLLIHPEASPPTFIDFRETASAAATLDMFVAPERRTDHRRVGVPGTVRGFALAHQRFGKLSWNELVEPAVALAKDGFALDPFNARSLNELLATSQAPHQAELRRVFSPSGTEWLPGDSLVQPDLTRTLRRLTANSGEDFYEGHTADLLVEEMRRGGGLVTREDLTNYRAIERNPVIGSFHGLQIVGAPPPSSGGTTLIQMLNILEALDLRGRDRWSPATLHLIVESMRRAYRDRAAHVGDPDFSEVPVEWLIDKARARRLADSIDPAAATPSTTLAGHIEITQEPEQTTHFSVRDAAGLAVSCTYTLENSYGSRVVVEGAGFLLNDEMNDFNWLPGVTNTAGRIGTPPNLIAPGKRIVSSMCPTIVTQEGAPVLVTGSPGGRTIINTVLQVILNRVAFGMDLQPAVDAPRVHHQWLPDRVQMERSLDGQHPRIALELRRLGHQVDLVDRQGDAHSIAIDVATRAVTAAADRRVSGFSSSSR